MSELVWRKSKKCSNAACVEVALAPQGALVRDSKLEDSPVLSFDDYAWRNFMRQLKEHKI